MISSGEDHGRYVYRLAVKPGWFLPTNCPGWLLVPTSGGSVPLLGSLSLGDLGFLVFFGVSDSSLSDDAMVHDHHLQSVRSVFLVHVASDVLLKTVPKIQVLRQEGGRLQAGSSGRRRQGRPGV